EQGRLVVRDAALPAVDARRFPDAGAGRGAEPVLQPGAGHGSGLAAPETHHGVLARSSAVAVFPARTWSDGALRLVRPALGHRAIQARGSAVSRGRTDRTGAVVPPPVPGQGTAAEHGPGVGVLRADRGALLAGVRRGRPPGVSRTQRHRAPGVRRDAHAFHGHAVDDAARPGAGAPAGL